VSVRVLRRGHTVLSAGGLAVSAMSVWEARSGIGLAWLNGGTCRLLGSAGPGGKMAMKRLFILITFALILSGCSSVQYMTDFDTDHDFGSDRSFAFFERARRGGNSGPAPNAIVAGRIRRAVLRGLGELGLNEVGEGPADLLVTYHIALEQGMEIFSSGWGMPYYGCRGGWAGGYSTTRTVTRGTLILDILNSRKRSLVWRGIAGGAFDRPNPDEEEVMAIVERLLADFPARRP